MLLTKTDNCGSTCVLQKFGILRICLGKKPIFYNVTLSSPGNYKVDYNNMMCVYIYIYLYILLAKNPRGWLTYLTVFMFSGWFVFFNLFNEMQINRWEKI